MKTYVILLPFHISVDRVVSIMSASNQFDFWFTSFKGGLFVRTHLGSKAIFELLDPQLGANNIFIGEVTANYWGRMPEQQWAYFTNKPPRGY